MVFDAQSGRLHSLGACSRGIYDNRKRRWRRSSSARIGNTIAASSRCARTILSSPSLACTPARGLGEAAKSRTRSASCGATPRLRVKSYDELNAWLMDKCACPLRACTSGTFERTIREVFEEERPKLIPYRGRFGWSTPCRPRCRRPAWSGRQQQILGQRQRRWSAGRHPRLCRSHCDPPGRADCGEHRRALAAARRFMIPGIRAGSARKPGALQRRAVQGLGVPRRWTARRSWPGPTTATGRW